MPAQVSISASMVSGTWNDDLRRTGNQARPRSPEGRHRDPVETRFRFPEGEDPAIMTHPEAGMSSLRRALLVLAVVVTLVAGLGATIEPAAAAAYRTTANLNLRTGPGTSYALIRTIPSGATVEVTGDAQSGFLPVTYLSLIHI